MRIPVLNKWNGDVDYDVPSKKEAMQMFDDFNDSNPRRASIALIESDETNYTYTFIFDNSVNIYGLGQHKLNSIYGAINSINLLRSISRNDKDLDSFKVLKSRDGAYSIESLILNIQKVETRLMKSKSRDSMLIKDWLKSKDLLYKKGMAT